MDVVFCGTSSGGRTLNPDRANASILVDTGDGAVLLDCGPGSLERLIRSGHGIRELRAVFLSHVHHDHVLALPELLLRRSFRGSGGPLPVYGPVGTTDLIARCESLVAFLAESRVSATFESAGPAVEVPAGETVTIGAVSAISAEVPHAPELQCFGWKITSGESTVVYSGDTSAAPDVMVPFATGADLLIHDAFSEEAFARLISGLAPDLQSVLRDRVPSTHSEARDVGRIAEAAGVKRLALTSIFETEEAESLREGAAEHFSGPVVVAEDGLVLEV
jgi:ribonuclease BN (tRNA processing enzyme)